MKRPGSDRSIRTALWGAVVLLLVLPLAGSSRGGSAPDVSTTTPTAEESLLQAPADAFQRVWGRLDGPVANGAANRTWIWGPAESAFETTEPYAESPGGQRLVRYYDKSRMEINQPDADPASPWYVTNGLLAKELITGQRQTGDQTFEERAPAVIGVAGDPGDDRSPTYATLGALLGEPPRSSDSVITERLAGDGTIVEDPALALYNVRSAERVQAPGIDHQVASVFWEFLHRSGPIQIDGMMQEGQLFPEPFYATGLPITEAYWVRVRVAEQEQDVLVQAFERRVLTFTPGNPAGWQVESANVGQHYRRWLERADAPTPPPTVTATPAPTAPAAPTTQPSTTPELVTVGPGAVDAWMRSIVRDSQDRVWIAAINNNAFYQRGGPGELVLYRATTIGIPTAFEPVDAATQPSQGGADIPFADAAIDGSDRLHIAWVDRGQAGQPVLYGVFDLMALSWVSGPEIVDQTGLAGFGGNAAQGGLSLALDHNGDPLLAYAATGNHSQIRVRERTGGGWSDASEPLQVDGAFVWHPALGLAPDGTWNLAAYDATNQQILATSHGEAGWKPATIVANGVLGPEDIDQGPAMLVLPDGTALILYLDGASHLRLSADQGAGWTEISLGGNYFTHAPGIGLLADGDLVIAGHDENHPPQHLNMIQGNASGWGDWEPLVAVPADGSEVFRWAGAFSTPRDFSDLVFFDEDSNDDGVLEDQTLYYIAVPDQGR